jgi:hypothetical protein
LSINTLGEHALSGHEAIEALSLYIKELENTKAEGSEISHLDIRIKMAKAISEAIRSNQESKAEIREETSALDTSSTKIELTKTNSLNLVN